MKIVKIIYFLLLSTWVYAQSLPIEINGFIVVEAEDYQNQSEYGVRKWEIIENSNVNAHAMTASKNKYLKCLPDTRVTHDDTLIQNQNFSNQSGKMAILHYDVEFNTTGRYYVWVRAYSSGSEDNGLHAGIDQSWPENGKRMQWCEGKNKWTWASKQRTEKNHCGEPYLIYLDVNTIGRHTIKFSMREDGFEFDKFILTTDKDFDPNRTIKRSQIYIRDPFVYADKTSQTYFMFSSAYPSEYLPEALNGVVVYSSKDLENWTMPQYVFKTPKNWWASDQHRVWAPEVHIYKGKYYLFATFTNPEISLSAIDPNAKACVRGTAILVSDTLDGTYLPLSKTQATPPEWMALDGTLFLENNKPMMVFCREWIQVKDGTMETVALKDNLSGPKGKPKTLFKASDATWVKELETVKSWNTSGYITDGPWFYRTKSKKLLMLWSSFGAEGYSVGVAESSNGKLSGKWKQKDRLFDKDGGHAMIFETLDNRMILTLHQPNSGDIRARFYNIIEENDTLKIGAIIPFK